MWFQCRFWYANSWIINKVELSINNSRRSWQDIRLISILADISFCRIKQEWMFADSNYLSKAEQVDIEDPLASFRERFTSPDPGLIYLDGNSPGRLPLHTINWLNEVISSQWDRRRIISDELNFPSDLYRLQGIPFCPQTP